MEFAYHVRYHAHVPPTVRTFCFPIAAWTQLTALITGRELPDMVHLILQVISTFHLDPADRPPDNVYVALLQHGRVHGTFKGFDGWPWQSVFGVFALDLSSSLIRRAQHSTLSQQETNRLKDNLAHCIECLDVSLPNHPYVYLYVAFSIRLELRCGSASYTTNLAGATGLTIQKAESRENLQNF